MHQKASLSQADCGNPYAPPLASDGDSSGRNRRADASMLWFAGVTFVPFFAKMFSNDAGHIVQIGLGGTIAETMFDVIPPVVIAVVFFLITRTALRAEFYYQSTRQSLMLTGLLASVYLILVDYCSWYSMGVTFGIQRSNVWWVGMAVGILVAAGLIAIDRYFGNSSPGNIPGQR